MLPTRRIWYYRVHWRSCQEPKVVQDMNLVLPVFSFLPCYLKMNQTHTNLFYYCWGCHTLKFSYRILDIQQLIYRHNQKIWLVVAIVFLKHLKEKVESTCHSDTTDIQPTLFLSLGEDTNHKWQQILAMNEKLFWYTKVKRWAWSLIKLDVEGQLKSPRHVPVSHPTPTQIVGNDLTKWTPHKGKDDELGKGK